MESVRRSSVTCGLTLPTNVGDARPDDIVQITCLGTLTVAVLVRRLLIDRSRAVAKTERSIGAKPTPEQRRFFSLLRLSFLFFYNNNIFFFYTTKKT